MIEHTGRQKGCVGGAGQEFLLSSHTTAILLAVEFEHPHPPPSELLNVFYLTLSMVAEMFAGELFSSPLSVTSWLYLEIFSNLPCSSGSHVAIPTAVLQDDSVEMAVWATP